MMEVLVVGSVANLGQDRLSHVFFLLTFSPLVHPCFIISRSKLTNSTAKNMRYFVARHTRMSCGITLPVLLHSP
jgi:hypothetical protein